MIVARVEQASLIPVQELNSTLRGPAVSATQEKIKTVIE
jgi:hypothetical protein